MFSTSKHHFIACMGALQFFTNLCAQQKSYSVLRVPATSEYCSIKPGGSSVLPSGRYVTPAGKTIQITRAPYGLGITPDGKKALILHNAAITIVNINNPDSNIRIPDYEGKIKVVLRGASFLGVAFSADSKKAYLSGGDKGDVVVFDMDKFERIDSITLNGNFDGVEYEDSFTSDLTIDQNRNELYVLDRANYRMVRIDLNSNKIVASVKVGRIPFGIALSPDRNTLFVANVGLYEYPVVPGVTPTNKDSMMLDYPPYGVHTKESEIGVMVKGRKIPGLGSPLVPEAMSVWTIDLNNNKVMDKFKTGYQIGQMIEGSEIVGGSSPNSIVVGNRFAYVSNASNDLITVIDYHLHKIVDRIPILIDKNIDHYRGLMPFGLALGKDEGTLYAALLGFNAIAVIDTKSKQTRGLIPTGWGTTKLALSGDEKKIFVTSARGYGAGPNGGKDFVDPPQGTYIGDIQLGTFQCIDMPDAKKLNFYTRQTIDNTFKKVEVADDGKNPCPLLPNTRKSPIQYIVYITKENRSYDEVFGQLETGKGDSSLARYGINVSIPMAADKTKIAVSHANVMPNHLKAARQFSYSDNFYCDSDASIHGHHWMVGTIPNEYVETNAANAGEFKIFSKAPGRRMPRTSGAIDPEDYNEIGGLWESMERNKVDFFNFGEANEYAGVEEEWNQTKIGSMQPVVFPMPKALWKRTSRNYAGFNTNIPDQFRMDQFEGAFTKKWIKGKEKMPSLITMQVPNDHGASPRPEAGYPYVASYMADNDLALGRILHFLSRTKYWKKMLVIITEDDPQGGVDHIDAHRSVLMMAGPYVKRGYVSHTHANFGSILKTIYNILNTGYVNQYDATGSLLQDFFTDKPDYSVYTVEPVDKRVFDPQIAMDPYKKNFDWHKIIKGPEMDDEEDIRRNHYNQHPVGKKKQGSQ